MLISACLCSVCVFERDKYRESEREKKRGRQKYVDELTNKQVDSQMSRHTGKRMNIKLYATNYTKAKTSDAQREK